jgi:LytS/YehU family sensor histidine kinase
VATFGAAAVAASAVLVMIAIGMAYAISHPEVLAGGRTAIMFGMGILLYLFSTGIHYAALGVQASLDAERRAAEARTLAREAELRALKMQLNPHFLFNSLHSIGALAMRDGGRAREMCVRLADFLRSSLRLGDRESIPLREELALARSYLKVEHVLLEDRLRVEEKIDSSCEGCAVPALLLQPLIENAVKHGIAGLVEGGAIRLAAMRRGDSVAITIENGFDPDAPAERTGLGLAHVRRRLQVRYGEAAEFDAGPADGLYRVQLRLPCEAAPGCL